MPPTEHTRRKNAIPKELRGLAVAVAVLAAVSALGVSSAWRNAKVKRFHQNMHGLEAVPAPPMPAGAVSGQRMTLIGLPPPKTVTNLVILPLFGGNNFTYGVDGKTGLPNGRTYVVPSIYASNVVSRSTNLRDWTVIKTLPGTGGFYTFTDTNGGAVFFKVAGIFAR